MSKKRLAESVDGPAATTDSTETLSRKKSKKSKSSGDASNGVADVELKKSKKEKKTSKDENSDVSTDDAEVAAKLKAERKAAKKAKKAKKAAAAAAQEPAPETNGDKQKDVSSDKAKAKAERKAEKARLKALKKEAKASGTATPSEPVSTVSSVAPSQVQSSVTSPEPFESTIKGYRELPELSALPQSEIDTFLSTKQITITDESKSKPSYRPITSFKYLPSPREIQSGPFAKFTEPSPIQAAAWPWLLAGRDVVGVAETGSGKTFAFGLPCIRHIKAIKGSRGVKAVIVSPTRELASQIHEQLEQLAKPAGLNVACIYGGVPKEPQYQALKTASIIVATPGRLNDLIEEGAANLGQVSYCVLDEADRMLDKGFEQEIRKIIGTTPTIGRQTLMFTATWPPSVRDLAMTFMKNPIKITIGDNHTGELRANTRITQTVEVIEPHDKNFRLIQLLKQYQSGKNKDDRILVFCLYKKEATRVEEFIRSKGFRVAGIHGDLSQQKRTESLEAFKKGHVPLLVATDVAARGLDIPAVKVVINVTFPLTAEDYVHRIGRTGRAGQDGLAITFFTEHDKGLSGALINVLKAANQPVPDALLRFGGTVKKKAHDAYGAFFKDTGDMKAATKITFDD